MEIVYFLLPCSLLLALLALAGYIWSVRNGQLDDLDTPAMRMLFDDEPQKKTEEGIAETKKESTDT